LFGDIAPKVVAGFGVDSAWLGWVFAAHKVPSTRGQRRVPGFVAGGGALDDEAFDAGGPFISGSGVPSLLPRDS
jgi:hypothetical protein